MICYGLSNDEVSSIYVILYDLVIVVSLVIHVIDSITAGNFQTIFALFSPQFPDSQKLAITRQLIIFYYYLLSEENSGAGDCLY
jgi:hypothetical protein